MERKEAIEVVKKNWPDSSFTMLREALETLIPELKESDDERIGKEIVNFINHRKAMGSITPEESKRAGSWIAWLEKQCEQKPIKCNEKWYDFVRWFVKERTDNYTLIPSDTDIHTWGDIILDHAKKELEKQSEEKPTDKVEPKFHEGDWLCENEPNNYARFIQILEIVNVQGKERYRISRDINNDEDIVGFDFVEKYYHKFDIKDARDGDVLTCYSDIKGQPIEQTGIIKQYVGRHGGCSNSFKAHFGVDWDNNVVIEGYMGSSNIYPATKKQRDTLLKAMADAGYTFDFEKKELKKIEEEVNGEDYGIDSLYHAQRILEKTLGSVDGYQSDDGILDHKAAITAVKKLYEQQKTAEWSEEDKNTLDFLVDYLLDTIKKMPAEEYAGGLGKAVVLLKSLKDRVQPQPKQEWSEEDEYKYNTILHHLDLRKEKYKKECNQEEQDRYQCLYDWFKSIRHQNTWKPSELQIEALESATENCAYSEYQDCLRELIGQLKKLREE